MRCTRSARTLRRCSFCCHLCVSQVPRTNVNARVTSGIESLPSQSSRPGRKLLRSASAAAGASGIRIRVANRAAGIRPRSRGRWPPKNCAARQIRRVERKNRELERRLADEAREQEHVLGLLPGQWSALPRGVASDRKAGVDLEPRTRPWWERADSADHPGADEVRLAPTWHDGGNDQTGIERAELLEPAEPIDDVFERLDPVAEACCFLIAQTLGQVGEALAEAG